MNYSNLSSRESAIDGEKNRTSSYKNIVVINCVLNGPMVLASILGNFLVFTAIWRTSSLRSPSMTFLSSLAVTDFLVGLVVQPMYIASSLTNVYFLNIATAMMAFAACGVSLGTMAAISLDRFLALHYHMRYNALMTSFRAITALMTIWLTTSLFSCLVFWSPSIYIAVMAILISVYLVISAYFYIRIYHIVREHQLRIQHQEPGSQQISEGQLSSQNRLIVNRSALNTFVFYICTIFCYLPRFISVQLSDLDTYRITAWIFTDTLIFLNSAINPVLFCWRLRDLRAAVFKVLREWLCKQMEGNP